MTVFLLVKTLSEADKKQGDLLDVNLDFNNKVRPRSKADKEAKSNTYKSANLLYQGHELTLNAFKSGIFPIKATHGEGLKNLSPKKMFRRLPVALAQVQTGNTSEKLLNEIRQIIYSLYWAK